MRLDRLAATASVLMLAACSAGTTTTAASNGTGPFDDFGTFNGARVEVVAEGGFAALSIRDASSHDDRSYVHVQRHLCTQSCPAPMDSTSGALSAAASDSLFNIVLEQARQLDRNDYGTTRNGADMMSYTLRITAGSTVRTVTADDGTMPQPMRRIVEAVRGSIAAARR
jgi:hypothetical protein